MPVHADGQGGLGGGIRIPDGHDAQVDGVQGQLSQDSGQDGRNPAEGVKEPCHQAGQHSGQQSGQQGQPGVPALADAQSGHGAPGGQRAIYGQVGHIEDAVGDIHSDGHNAPGQSLSERAGQGVEKGQQKVHSDCSSEQRPVQFRPEIQGKQREPRLPLLFRPERRNQAMGS